jgi:DNA-binding response OmpR family regulator
MSKSIKNLRQLSNAKLLVVSNDSQISDKIGGMFKECILLSEDQFNKVQDDSFDLIIIDIPDEKVKTFCSNLNDNMCNISKIIIANNESEDVIKTAINCLAYAVLSKPINFIDLQYMSIMSLNQTKRGDKKLFQDGIYYDNYREKFFNKRLKQIELTKLEHRFLKLLIEKTDEIVNYDTIQEIVWQGKDMSVFTMRNVVNKIRQKTYHDIIKNHSNRGYSIDSSHFE